MRMLTYSFYFLGFMDIYEYFYIQTCIYLIISGMNFLSGTTLGLEHVKEIHEETCVLAKHAQVLANHFKVIDMQISNVSNTLKEWKELQQVLTDIKTKFGDRISFLEKNVIEIKSVSNIGKVY